MEYSQKYKPMEIVCREGDDSNDLLYLQQGSVLAFLIQGTQVKPLAKIESGEFLGELSFFDGLPRSSYMIALEDSVILKISRPELVDQLPFWFLEAGKNLTKKIRFLDDIVHASRIKKASSMDQKPLSIEEQRQILSALRS
jgi:CRP-like cAMP-binding protein